MGIPYAEVTGGKEFVRYLLWISIMDIRVVAPKMQAMYA
jgi:hypothetical protein